MNPRNDHPGGKGEKGKSLGRLKKKAGKCGRNNFDTNRRRQQKRSSIWVISEGTEGKKVRGVQQKIPKIQSIILRPGPIRLS